jgi:hypothetical protein
MFAPFPYLGSALILTVVLAVLLWYERSTRQKPVSYAAIFGPPVFANAAVAIAWIWYHEGWLFFTPEAWEFGRGGASADVILAAFTTVFCVLSTWVVAVSLQKHTARARFPNGIVSAARKLTWHHPLVLWLAVVTPTACYGFLGDGFDAQNYSSSFYLPYAIRAMLPLTGMGFAVGTCLAAGALAIRRVRNGALNKGLAIVLAIAASGLAAIAPAATMVATGYYHGMGGLAVIFVGEMTVCIAILGLLISTTWVLFIRRH